MGVATRYRDGLGRDVVVGSETLVGVCAALGAELATPADAAKARDAFAAQSAKELIAPVVLAWDGLLPEIPVTGMPIDVDAVITLEDGSTIRAGGPRLGIHQRLPPGYHRLQVQAGGREATSTIISAPVTAWRSNDDGPSWGVSAHLSALRSRRSRSLGDLADLATVCDWLGSRGVDVVTLLPLLPTFNDIPCEPSPYSPVSRLFWSELILDLGAAHRSASIPEKLDVNQASQEVRAALATRPAPAPAAIDPALAAYAAFRGAQRKLGRDWRSWPEQPRHGRLAPAHIDADEERFHLVSQLEASRQLGALRGRLGGVRLGLDLAVGVHPHGYDSWSRPDLFATGMSVGAPPDAGFPSGQGWGFPPVLPRESQLEGHAYIAASIAHQASLAGLLRIDHIMAMNRLYWIPDGLTLAEGTYVEYPTEELFAVICLESHRNRCEVVGENLGTVPVAIDEALPRHGIRGMYLAEFAAAEESMSAPAPDEVAMISTHDTPTLAGWVDGIDIDERVRLGLLAAASAPGERAARRDAAEGLADLLGAGADPEILLSSLMVWLGESLSPLVTIWLEDLWLETEPVNVPGSGSAERPNWQRPMARLLDDVTIDPKIEGLLDVLNEARKRAAE